MNNSKPLTIKSFLHKSNSKASNSAIAFLKSYRTFLESGELAPVTGEILAQIDAQEVMPTIGLDMIRRAVLTHHMQIETRRVEAKLQESAERVSTNPWAVVAYDSKGNIAARINENGKTVPIQKSFMLAQRASEWADRRLVSDCASDCFAVITHQPTAKETIVLRNDAMARMFPKNKSPLTKKTGSRDSKLSFSTKAIQSRSHFSRG